MIFKWLNEPKYHLGQQVWVIDNKKVFADRIFKLCVELFHRYPDPDQVCGYLLGYNLGFYNTEDDVGLWREEELYPNEEMAMFNARWVPVTLTEEEWLATIGSEDRDGEPELSPGCCGQIGLIRDMLFTCKRQGGMIVADVKKLQKALDHHEPLTSDAPNLNKIFTQLGVNWHCPSD